VALEGNKVQKVRTESKSGDKDVQEAGQRGGGV